jgi:hypothetical protein
MGREIAGKKLSPPVGDQITALNGVLADFDDGEPGLWPNSDNTRFGKLVEGLATAPCGCHIAFFRN